MEISTFERLERKILINESILQDFMNDLLEYMNPDAYNQGGKPYMICNLYFDNDNDDVIRYSVSKPKFKEKLRLRSYGVPTEDSKVFIEIKRKLYGVGTKRRAKITLKQINEYLSTGKHPENLPYIDERVLSEIDYFMKVTPVYPKVYISYMRNAFFGKEDSSFRVTLDQDIITRRYDLDLALGRYGDKLLPEGKVLLEIKFSGALPLWFSHLLDKYKISFGTYSKYGQEFLKYKYEQIQSANQSEVSVK